MFLGVVTDKPTTTEAQAANSIAINDIIATIKKEGIKDEDIKTTNYSINPKYDYDKSTGKSVLVGYTVSNTLNVTVKDISKVGQIIDTAVVSGIPSGYPVAINNKLMAGSSPSASTSIQVGTYKVKANVNLVYEY